MHLPLPQNRALRQDILPKSTLRLAYRSKGGKGFICINSSRVTKDGERKSNILATIPGGSTISAPRTMIQYVATEYGIASLSGKTLRERAEAMASIAHPDFREELMKYAQENFK